MIIGNSFASDSVNYINQNKTDTESVLSKIAASRELSGQDSADLMISDSLASQISTLTQGVQNSNDAIGMLQIADSALFNLSQNAEKLNELSVKSNSAALNSSQQSMIKQEFSATTDAMKDIVETTSFNGKSIFNDSLSFETGSGEVSVTSLGITGIDNLSDGDQVGIQEFASTLSSLQSEVASSTQQFSVGIANSLSAISNLTSSVSQIEETPMNEKIAQLNSNETKLDASILAQAHQNTQLQQRVSALLV